MAKAIDACGALVRVCVFSVFSSLRTTCEGLRLQNGIQQVVETHQKAKYVACGQCSTSVVETWQNLQNARHFAKVGCGTFSHLAAFKPSPSLAHTVQLSAA